MTAESAAFYLGNFRRFHKSFPAPEGLSLYKVLKIWYI